MKANKFLLYTIAIASFSMVKAQNLNNLSLDEFYYEICFDEFCLFDIISAHGNSGNIQSLFNFSVTKSRDDEDYEKSITYVAEGYTFIFESPSTAKTDMDYYIAYIYVEGDSTVKIKNIEIGIGDNISKLGNVKILEPGFITFINSDTDASLDIFYSDNIITEIKFVFY